ncbi:MAG: DUF1592 domain-containing protein [Akkermansiaceae bacterium]|jgi:hypothetical protein
MVRSLSLQLCLIACTFSEPEPVILYLFEGHSNQILDSSKIEPPVHLDIPDPGAVSRQPGALTIQRSTLIQSSAPPIKLIKAVQKSGEFSLSAWITPANLTQAGPARIISLSKDSSNRNVTLGQDGAKFDTRFRTNQTGPNGIPSLSSGRVVTEKTHVAFIRSRGGQGSFYLNGQKIGQKQFSGDLNSWDQNFHLALGNEFTKDRPWLGTFHQIALYATALTESEITVLAKEGHIPPPPQTPAQRSQYLFVNHIEPIIARHCLECHDSTTAEGDLDLSQKRTAFLDPDIIFAGHLKKSLVWESVESDEMPEKRTPLSPEEKNHLSEWIATGAAWTSENIDPAAHLLLTEPKKFPRRLTLPEYLATVQATTGIDVTKEATELLPPDLRTDGFRNTAYNLGVDLKHVEAHTRLADLIVSKLDLQQFAARFSKNRSLTQKPIRSHIEAIGHWLLRGPLDEREVDLYQGIATTVGASGGDFDQAMGYILRGILQSPRFLYRIEAEGPPTSYELASRLSYLIWGGPPDQALLDAAKNTSLLQPDALRKHVERMLRDPRALAQSLAFISEWLNLPHLDNLQPNSKMFPDWEPALANDMRRETLAFARHLLWDEKRPLGDLLNARVTFLTPRLAKHYGLTPQQEDFTKYDLSRTPRGGILTQGSLLTIGGDEASMVSRGLFVLHDLLRGSVKDPPSGVDTTPVPSAPGMSHRVVAERRMLDESCGGCHAKFEPLAFGLEQFDGLARYANRDHFGNDLREDGEILIPGTSELIKYENSRQLMDLLAKSPRVRQNIIWKLTQFALGRPIAHSDRPHLDTLFQNVQDQQTYQNVLLHLATSPLITQ